MAIMLMLLSTADIMDILLIAMLNVDMAMDFIINLFIVYCSELRILLNVKLVQS